MNPKLGVFLLFVVVLGNFASIAVTVDTSVGVQEGDWMEYVVTVTGSYPYSTPVRLRVDIQEVDGLTVTCKLTTNLSDGTQDIETLPFLVGTEEAFFIAPAHLESGDTFASITISGVDEKIYAGMNRTVVSGTIDGLEMPVVVFWDQTTGIMCEFEGFDDDYTMTLKADVTNLWEPEFSELPNPPFTMFYAVIFVAAILFVGFFVMRRR
jgi:hypothetical protein